MNPENFEKIQNKERKGKPFSQKLFIELAKIIATIKETPPTIWLRLRILFPEIGNNIFL